jgi:hypothetical protein
MKRWMMTWLVGVLAGCGSGVGGGGGGGIAIAGVAGSACAPAGMQAGCRFDNGSSQAMACQGGVWTLKESCANAQACVVQVIGGQANALCNTGTGGDTGNPSDTAGPTDAQGSGDTTQPGDTGNPGDTIGPDVQDTFVPDTFVPDSGPDISKPACGNGTCDPGESSATCAQDCPGSVLCGDGVCSAGESCPTDCKANSCGNDLCEPADGSQCPADCNDGGFSSCEYYSCGATSNKCKANAGCQAIVNCIEDCGGSAKCLSPCMVGALPAALAVFAPHAQCMAAKSCFKIKCGDGACQAPKETGFSCAQDCKAGGPICGDGTCSAPEGQVSCPLDCGLPGGGGPTAVCGNGSCESGETSSSCAADCGAKPVCGNGKCESGETASGCPSDCSIAGCCVKNAAKCGLPSECAGLGTSCGSCASGKSCNASTFQCEVAGPTCGDLQCAPGEQNSCPTDCATGVGDLFQCVLGACPDKWLACQLDTNCIGWLNCNAACGCDSACGQSCANQLSSSGQAAAEAVSQCASSAGCKSGCSTGTVCGNGTCEAGESSSSCPSDCPATDSCDGHCGGQAPGGCYCDKVCVQSGDCCPDYGTFCP